MGTYILIGVGVIVIAMIAISIVYYNKLQRYNIHVDNVFANLDAILMRRVDELSKLVDMTRQHVEDENEILQGVIGLRQQIIDATNVDDKVKAHNNMNRQVPNFMLQAERYPDIKFSDAYKHLQRSITNIEENIQAGRQSYNQSVGRFNTEVTTFPGNIFAGIFRFGSRPMFEAPAEKREDVDLRSMFSR
ncbi:LemA family protein [Alkalicoccobacillus murimartini]|uniref:LemA protein n=1 Tax=Alkalicoccobacillus murimartini TaxID=171685 RepID=A0ABT9YIL4_9BACI|nr:LemA family protein [Alkalicoccobacillus murimartini]MDQ0207448.1 LemA protein [Alkalicoccobacillus murimartini]